MNMFIVREAVHWWPWSRHQDRKTVRGHLRTVNIHIQRVHCRQYLAVVRACNGKLRAFGPPKSDAGFPK